MHYDNFFSTIQVSANNSHESGQKGYLWNVEGGLADKYGMPFGLTEHLGASFSQLWYVNKGTWTATAYKGFRMTGRIRHIKILL